MGSAGLVSQGPMGDMLCMPYLVGGLVAMNFIFPLILSFKSSQLTNSYFQRPPTRYMLATEVFVGSINTFFDDISTLSDIPLY